MKRATNKCVWLMQSRKETCGKSLCGRVLQAAQLSAQERGKMPTPCRGCGVGVLCNSHLCLSCGGGAFKKKAIPPAKKSEGNFSTRAQAQGGQIREMCLISYTTSRYV